MTNSWRQIIHDQLQLIIYSGLYTKSSNIYIGCLGSETDKEYLENLVSYYNKFEIVFFKNDIGLAEVPILQEMQNMCNKTNEDFLIWYIHTKGVFSGHTSWRKEMEALVVNQHQFCADLLLKNDKIGACGPKKKFGGFISQLNSFANNCHFSGNFWWAKSSYINSIKVKLTDIWQQNGHSRFMAEAFLGTAPNANEQMHNLETCEKIIDKDFDEEYYLENNIDVARSILVNGKGTGFDHFLRFGRTENRKFRFNPQRLCKIQHNIQPNIQFESQKTKNIKLL
jgi:hypothetical protein